MNILAIGNSFSEDATYYLKKIADSAGLPCKVVNLYIGGCSLEQHRKNIETNARAYRLELNGVYTDKVVSIADTLKEGTWDIVTVQQVSGLTGVYESYGENLKAVLNCIKTYAPKSRIYFHETWAYEIVSSHSDFSRYHSSQHEMAQAIETTVRRICRENGELPVIPSGEIIQKLRQTPDFDYQNGGLSLCRDGFHMDLIYGRYLLGLIWFRTLLNGNVDDVSFVPDRHDIVNGFTVDNFNCEPGLLQQLKNIVKMQQPM